MNQLFSKANTHPTSQRVFVFAALFVFAGSCATTRKAGLSTPLNMGPVQIVGDIDLEKLNDEELWAAGSAAFGSQDFKQAARIFARIADFHSQSRHAAAATYNAGLSFQRLKQWEEAAVYFGMLANPSKGTNDSLDASFRLAECYYHLDQYHQAIAVLSVIANRQDIDVNRRLEALVHQGVCELEQGDAEKAEGTLRKAIGIYHGIEDKELIEDYFPAQAQFFLGEIYRMHFESVKLSPDSGVEQLSKELEFKSELLLSAQGHYLRSIRMGNGYWATAAGAQIGTLYETLYDHMMNAPAPAELDADQKEVYQQEVRKRIRILLTKAITIYERTLETAERIGAVNPFIERTKESLRKMKEQLLKDSALDTDVP